MIIEALQEIYGIRQGLSISGGQITEWPYEEEQPSAEELDLIVAEYKARKDYINNRRREYPSLDELIIALLEKEEGRPEALNAYMLKRAQIKNKYPKPL